MPSVPADVAAWRKKTGADRWDEVWDGILHMPPVPTFDHQDLQAGLLTWLRARWAAASAGRRVLGELNVARPGRWPDDYRIPDVCLLTAERMDRNRGTHLDGGPDVVIEIASPGDESVEKVPFYVEVGVREVWRIDRDARRPELFVARDGVAERVAAGEDGAVASPFTGVVLRAADGRLVLRLADDDATEASLP